MSLLSSSVVLDPGNPPWAEIPPRAAVFALFAADERAEPYISRTPNLRNRLRRLLDAKPSQTKRLRLTRSIARIEYTLTGSDFESWFLLYVASSAAFGERARKRLHLRPPSFLRMTMDNAYPRVYVTNRITKSAAADLFGPFPSRLAAESFLEGMLNLFELRRCYEDLNPDPAFPGCVYSEMKKCLAPCFNGCTDERYSQEAAAVHAFFATRGQSLIDDLARQRDQASDALDFEKAAEIHARLSRVEAAAALAAPAVHSLASLNGVIVQPSADPGHIALFLLNRGSLAGPALYSVAGMRHHNEQSGSTSLFAHPASVAAVPLEAPPIVQLAARDELEARLDESLNTLAVRSAKSAQQIADHLSLFTRWYYRPQARRIGEAIFAGASGDDPREQSKKQLMRAISRVYRQSQSVREPDVQNSTQEMSASQHP
ncbi:MAG TPA: UvrB/UvrC motif-containing protein, partial [Silvibacterium sp.]|nr:UvrB/UvrC motif-containing protein [Silvibacterium sp.]